MGKALPLPTDGTISALNIPHSSIVFDMHRMIEIEAELSGGNGLATETIRYANLVSFTRLQAFAFDDRCAHDLIYCIEHSPDGMAAVAETFRAARSGKHRSVVERALEMLRTQFATTNDDPSGQDGVADAYAPGIPAFQASTRSASRSSASPSRLIAGRRSITRFDQ